MKNPQQIIKFVQKFADDNAPALLTALGVTGVVSTAYLTGKATFKAADILEQERYKRSIHRTGVGDSHFTFDRKEKLRMLWKLYIPAAGVGSFTILSIVMANRIGTRRTAAMAAAYTISERAYSEYKDKVVETIGQNKEEQVRAAVQQDRVNRDEVDGQIFTAKGKVLCKDAWSGRYFESTWEDIKTAQNNINYQILHHNYASLTDFYTQLCLEKTKESDEVGWNSDKMLEVTRTSAISSNNEPVLVMDFAVAPVRNFFRSKL